MSRPTKRSRPVPEYMEDDPEDETYGSRPSPRKKQRVIQSRPKAKRVRGYGGGDGDIDDDEDDDPSDEDASADDISEVSDEEPSPVVKTQSGRPARSSAASAKYREPDTDEELDVKDEIENSEDERPRARGGARQSKSTFMVKLKIPPGRTRRSSRPATGSKGIKPSDSLGVRRSSRISHDDVAPLVSLTGSGRHEQIERPGSADPEPSSSRQTRAGKRPPTTSTVIEASFEESQERQEPALTQQSMFTQAEDVEEAIEEDEVAPRVVHDAEMDEGIIAESIHGADDDDEEGPVIGRQRRPQRITQQFESSRRTRRSGVEEKDTSDFEPAPDEAEEEEALSPSEHSRSPAKVIRSEVSSQQGRRSTRLAKKRPSQRDGSSGDESEGELDPDELAEEAEELRAGRRNTKRRRRTSVDITYDKPRLRDRRKAPDYRIYRPELQAAAEEDDDDNPSQAAAGSRRTKGLSNKYKSLWTTQGPFGAAGPSPLGMSGGIAAHGGADSDSSEDEIVKQASRAVAGAIGGAIGMTPTNAVGQALFPPNFNSDAILGAVGPTDATSTAVGKLKDKKLLADADPLGVDQNVNFDGVGGLANHINQLKEMVMLPLLYPEIFLRMHIVPPRGVLFHGPPGTGKTLLARALASSVSSQGKKVTFYMRKGADALSKWIGEAEKQLRLLFEEARKNQPSIIFFDEIDGLAPVRSSRQEQIHASIVATLLALMDGMDGRGQVIIIGATNRPDNVDPALRRPGRFDREFYFPLPEESARRSIIDIHTKGWDPPLTDKFKDHLASLTKGYGGADLRALCTEAALNAVQGTFPQIYNSDQKLLIDPSQIKVLAKDFMTSVNKMIPSSERQAPSGAAPLEASVEPLMTAALAKITRVLDEVMPEQKKLSALEEAQYGDRNDERGFEQEILQQRFDRARVFRPRLLVYGDSGMGQQYVGGALLQRYERLHVQSFDLSHLYSDTGRSAEAAVVQLFNEARRHKPSVIFIPNVDVWYKTVGESVLRLFKGLLRSIPPNEPVLVLGIIEFDASENEGRRPDHDIVKDIFGYSTDTLVNLERPDAEQRRNYFKRVIELIEMPPTEFPDLENRKKRVLPVLEIAPPPAPPPKQILGKAELKQQKKNDRMTLNMLKIKLGTIFEFVKKSHKKFRVPPIDPDLYLYLFDERDQTMVSTDLSLEQRQMQEQHRPYEMSKDEKGIDGIREVETGKFYYNLELDTIERRLVNGYYKRSKDFLADMKRLVKDARTLGDPDRIIKANHMIANVETDVDFIERGDPVLQAQCEQVYKRELEREARALESARQAREEGREVPKLISNVPPPDNSHSTTEVSGPIVLGVPVPGRPSVPQFPRSPMSNGYMYGGSDPAHSSDIGLRQIEYDVDMSNTDLLPPLMEPTASDANASQSRQTQSTQQRLQRAAMTPMAQGSQPIDYYNSASTTTSGKDKTSSDKSRLTNGTGTQHSGSNGTQSSGSAGARSLHPDFTTSMAQQTFSGTPLPDTQELIYKNSSSQSQPSSQSVASDPSQKEIGHGGVPTGTPMGPPIVGPPTAVGGLPQASRDGVVRQHSAPISQVLNAPSSPQNGPYGTSTQPRFQPQPVPAGGPDGSPPSPPPTQDLHSQHMQSQSQELTDTQLQPALVVAQSFFMTLHAQMVEASSGFSVEQLEQMMSAVMRTIWRRRAEWNRVRVAEEVREVFNETVRDIETMQRIAKMSQETDGSGDRARALDGTRVASGEIPARALLRGPDRIGYH